MAKYIVTGGCGFIGSNIVQELVKRKHKVLIIDNLSTGKEENIKEFKNQVTLVKGDIRNLALLQEKFKGADYVLHQAALGSVPRSVADPISSNDNNINGTLNALIAARDNNIKRFVYAASSSAYGNACSEYKVEDMPANPISPYALTKYAGEKYAQLFYMLYGLETVCLRYFNVFGPKQAPDSQYAAVIPKFITAIIRGEQPIIYGNGEQGRDFTFVRNNVEANILASTTKGIAGEVINIACGNSITLNQLIELITQNLGTKVQPIYEKERIGDVKNSKASIRKAEKMLNYKPLITFKEGLRETIEWYKNKMN